MLKYNKEEKKAIEMYKKTGKTIDSEGNLMELAVVNGRLTFVKSK
jgi:hypothetical protein